MFLSSCGRGLDPLPGTAGQFCWSKLSLESFRPMGKVNLFRLWSRFVFTAAHWWTESFCDVFLPVELNLWIWAVIQTQRYDLCCPFGHSECSFPQLFKKTKQNKTKQKPCMVVRIKIICVKALGKLWNVEQRRLSLGCYRCYAISRKLNMFNFLFCCMYFAFVQSSFDLECAIHESKPRMPLPFFQLSFLRLQRGKEI